MHSSYSRSSSPPDSQPPRQNKMILQRQYREKEGECFNALKDVIKDLTGEEPQTRQEILRKAIELLSHPEIGRFRNDVQALPGPVASPELPPVHEDTLAHTDHPVPSSHFHWQGAADFGPAHYQLSTHYATFQTDPYEIISNTNLSGSEVFSQGFDGGWATYR